MKSSAIISITIYIVYLKNFFKYVVELRNYKLYNIVCLAIKTFEQVQLFYI